MRRRILRGMRKAPIRPPAARPFASTISAIDRPEEVNTLIALIENALGRKANRVDVPLPPGDVLETRADVSDLRRAVGFAPSISLADGIGRFVEWYRDYHGA